MRWLLNTRNSVGPAAAIGSGVTRGLGGAGVERGGRGGGCGGIDGRRARCGAASDDPMLADGGGAGVGMRGRGGEGGFTCGPLAAAGGFTLSCDDCPAW